MRVCVCVRVCVNMLKTYSLLVREFHILVCVQDLVSISGGSVYYYHCLVKMGHQEKMLVGELPNLYCNHIVFISEATLVYLTLNMLLSEVDCFVSIDGTFRSTVGWGGKLL